MRQYVERRVMVIYSQREPRGARPKLDVCGFIKSGGHTADGRDRGQMPKADVAIGEISARQQTHGVSNFTSNPLNDLHTPTSRI